jgi:superfamily II RNA helicase
MVLICDKPYQNNDFQPHFDLYPFPLSDFQKYAIQAIVEGNHTLVTAHTGSGKTLPAEFAIHHFNQKQKKIIYTSPIKALSNQKFHDFSLKFPHISFGLFTGDIKTNPDADVLIMTTEILMNYLFNLNQQTEQPQLQFEMDIHNDLACVVFDEVHYINDKDRGQSTRLRQLVRKYTHKLQQNRISIIHRPSRCTPHPLRIHDTYRIHF